MIIPSRQRRLNSSVADATHPTRRIDPALKGRAKINLPLRGNHILLFVTLLREPLVWFRYAALC